jgi:hypothetical protein
MALRMLAAAAVLAGIGLSFFVAWRPISLPQPIVIPNATARWVDDRHFDVTAPEFHWNDTCSSIWVNWWVQTRRNGSIQVTTEAMIGPFKGRGKLPPRYEIAISPMIGPPIQLRVEIPDWLDPIDVLLVGVDDTVPNNQPCASGWKGVMQVFRLEIVPP